jgi:hypothetical protein
LAADGITRRTVKNNFGRAFNQAAERAETIHFALDGILNGSGGIQKALELGKRGFVPQNFTNAELNTIFSNKNLFNKTRFYFEGRPVSPLVRPQF